MVGHAISGVHFFVKDVYNSLTAHSLCCRAILLPVPRSANKDQSIRMRKQGRLESRHSLKQEDALKYDHGQNGFLCTK
jgi:hypothetical protein